MRNNKERMGAQSSAPAPTSAVLSEANQETKQFSFVNPTEFVEIPSSGRFYPEGHALHNCETIEIRHMTARDEDILTSQSLIKKGVAVDRMLQNIIVDKNVNIKDLYLGDKNALLVAARITGYGAEYSATISCPSCGASTKNTFDLQEVLDSGTSHDLDAISSDGTFTIKLPKLDVGVQVRVLTAADEQRMLNLSKKRKKDGLGESPWTDQLRNIIVSVEGVDDPKVLSALIENMPAFDSRHLRNEYQRNCPNIDMTQNFNCQECMAVEEVSVPLTAEFFWPR